MSVKVWPAMVTVPDRAAPPFAATLTVAAPSPEPAPTPEILNQDTLLAAVHEQPGLVRMLTETVPAPEPCVAAFGCSE